VRLIARDWISDESQVALLKVALDYERMAKALERLSDSKEIDSRLSIARSGSPHSRLRFTRVSTKRGESDLRAASRKK